MADHCFTPADLLRTEGAVLQALAFRVTAPTAWTFLCLLARVAGAPPAVAAGAAYEVELAMLDYAMLR